MTSQYWTKPYCGYQYLAYDKIHGTVCERNTMVETWIINRDISYWRNIWEKVFYKDETPNCLEVAKAEVEKQLGSLTRGTA